MSKASSILSWLSDRSTPVPGFRLVRPPRKKPGATKKRGRKATRRRVGRKTAGKGNKKRVTS